MFREPFESWTIQLVSHTMTANAASSNEKEAVALAEELSSQYPYSPVVLTTPEGDKVIYLDGCICPDYNAADDQGESA